MVSLNSHRKIMTKYEFLLFSFRFGGIETAFGCSLFKKVFPCIKVEGSHDYKMYGIGLSPDEQFLKY